MNPLIWIEQTALSTWFREALWAFPILLVIHGLGMAFLVGASIVVNWRALGFGSGISLGAMQPFFGVLYFGFVINLISGLALLWTYPAKALTNPVFFLKMGLVIAAVALSRRQQLIFAAHNGAAVGSVKPLAVVILLLWFAAITAGRLLAYTHSHLLLS